MSERPIFDVLLFDLGGVLVDFAGFDELERLVPSPQKRDAIRGAWIVSPTVQRFERGEGTARQFADGVIREFGLELTSDQFLSAFSSWASGPYAGARELLQELGASHRLACLSNSNDLHTRIHRRDLGTVFERCYFSEELGLVKPEPQIFEFVISDLGVVPERIAFFDDTPVNVDAARNAGLTAFEVDGFAALVGELRRLGLLDDSPDEIVRQHLTT